MMMPYTCTWGMGKGACVYKVHVEYVRGVHAQGGLCAYSHYMYQAPEHMRRETCVAVTAHKQA
jgi:hypothetical protein